MRDPFSWSLPLGRMFGITIRLHILFPLFILIIWLKVIAKENTPAGTGLEILIILGLLFVAVLLHEFGHCFGARLVDGEANEVLLWPLGGLANCDVPHTPRANFVCAAAGPLTNLLLCLLAGGVLAFCSLRPSFDPTLNQLWLTELYDWQGQLFGSELSLLAPNR